jgi:hypothetical protein
MSNIVTRAKLHGNIFSYLICTKKINVEGKNDSLPFQSHAYLLYKTGYPETSKF